MYIAPGRSGSSAERHRSTTAEAQSCRVERRIAAFRRGVASAARLYETAVWEKARGQ